MEAFAQSECKIILECQKEGGNLASTQGRWTAPSILDTRQPHFEAASNASGLIPSRCE